MNLTGSVITCELVSMKVFTSRGITSFSFSHTSRLYMRCSLVEESSSTTAPRLAAPLGGNISAMLTSYVFRGGYPFDCTSRLLCIAHQTAQRDYLHVCDIFEIQLQTNESFSLAFYSTQATHDGQAAAQLSYPEIVCCICNSTEKCRSSIYKVNKRQCSQN